ncbi:hypothetical protein EPN29_07955 [bacterium]|nr:MAG: hypothetical protein EPN29_07955 [bacterium]
MEAEESAEGQPAPKRRGRPPGSKNTAVRPRRKRAGGGDLIEQLNTMIADLIKENRKLKRQVVKLTTRGSAAATSTVERGLRTIQRRVQRALTGPAKRRRRGTAAEAPGRGKTVARRGRKTSS